MPTCSLVLPPVAESVSKARGAVRELLEESGRPEWAASAALAVSEIVTNAVLHARTTIEVTATASAALLLVEVADGGSGVPEQRHYGEQATTGRGMSLVAAVTSDHGVHQRRDGKVVWFAISDDAAEELTVDQLLDAWDLDGAPGDDVADGEVEVVLMGLPPRLWFAAREHHEALLRELALLRGPQVRDEEVDAARHSVWAALQRALAEAGEPPRPVLAGLPASLDLRLRLPRSAGRGFLALQDVLDEGEWLASTGDLLVRPALPEVVALRDWLCEQVIAQLAGAPASPWIGADAEHFATDVHRRDSVAGWESWAQSQPRGVVVADESNRIVAVTASLARALGWAADDLIGRRVVALVPPRLREAHVAGFTRHLATGEVTVMGAELALPVLGGDGVERPSRIVIEESRPARGERVFVAWITLEG